MIVAHGKNRVIGRDGDMPWRLRDDLRFFKETTLGHPVVMGRKTFESIGRPLPGRTNVVVTRNPDFAPDGVLVANSPEEALVMAEAASENGSKEPVFVIGGGQIYEALLPLAEIVYVTMVDATPEGDTRFPKLGDEWTWTALRRYEADERNDYGFTIYKVTRRSGAGGDPRDAAEKDGGSRSVGRSEEAGREG